MPSPSRTRPRALPLAWLALGLTATVPLAGGLLGPQRDTGGPAPAPGVTLAAATAPPAGAAAMTTPTGAAAVAPAGAAVPGGRPGALTDPGGSCSAPAGATIRDTVPGDDDFEGRWPHTSGRPITVYFAYGTLPARYQRFVRTGAKLWSRSPCVDAVAVPSCPARVNCSNVTVEARAEDDSDGNSDSVDAGGVRSGNTLTLYTDYLDKATESGALATTVHEMGHALGLMHRADRRSVMYEDTIGMDNAVPDVVDYRNLVSLYGGGRAPGRAD